MRYHRRGITDEPLKIFRMTEHAGVVSQSAVQRSKCGKRKVDEVGRILKCGKKIKKMNLMSPDIGSIFDT